MNGPVVIDEFGDVEEEAVYSFHRGNCKMSGIGISTPHQKYQRGRLGDGERRRLGVTKSQAPINKLQISYHFSLLENEFQKPKKLKESP
jgi:hypothetical protein